MVEKVLGTEDVTVIDQANEASLLSMDVYPVPSRDVVHMTIHNVSNYESATIQIVNLLGMVVKTDQVMLNEGSTTISEDISGLAAGTYVACVQMSGGKMITQKIVVE